MHIGLFTPSFPPMVDGGVAIATGRLALTLLERGHTLTVVTTPPPASLGDPLRQPAHLGPQRLLVSYGLVAAPLQTPAPVEALQTWLQQRHQSCPLDVLLAYFIYPAGYLATFLGDSLGIPVVCSCRGNDLTKDMFITPEIIATVLEHSAHVLCVSPSLLHMADTLIPCRDKATVVANAVDSALFTPGPRAPSPPGQPIVVGTSGLMRWKKGVDLFLPLLRRLCTTPAVRVLIAGYGLDAAMEQQMADFLERHHLRPQVEMTGPLPHAQMVHALRRMDLYVSTSYQEGMPNGVLEAMACALPVVATDADGTPELVQDGVTGYLCPMGDLEQLVQRCQALITQPALRRRLGQAGRQRVLQAFRPEQEATVVEEVLQRVCAQRGRS